MEIKRDGQTNLSPKTAFGTLSLRRTMKHPTRTPQGRVSATASTVTYVRDADGNLVKVRRSRQGSLRRAKATVRASKAPPATKSLHRAGAGEAAAPRPQPRSDAGLDAAHPARRSPVAESVAARYGVTVDAILSGERFRDTCARPPRMVAPRSRHLGSQLPGGGTSRRRRRPHVDPERPA